MAYDSRNLGSINPAVRTADARSTDTPQQVPQSVVVERATTTVETPPMPPEPRPAPLRDIQVCAQIELEHSRRSWERPSKRVTTTKTKISVDTEDVIALLCGLIAILFAIAMVFGAVPINTLTAGIVGLSGGGAVVAVIKARRGTGDKKSSWLLWAVVLALALVVVGVGGWLALRAM